MQKKKSTKKGSIVKCFPGAAFQRFLVTLSCIHYSPSFPLARPEGRRKDGSWSSCLTKCNGGEVSKGAGMSKPATRVRLHAWATVLTLLSRHRNLRQHVEKQRARMRSPDTLTVVSVDKCEESESHGTECNICWANRG